MKTNLQGNLQIFTLALEKRPRIPDLLRIRPPVMVPNNEVFFSKTGLIDCCIELMDPLIDVVSLLERSSNGMSPGGEKPDLNFSITTLVSCKHFFSDDETDPYDHTKKLKLLKLAKGKVFTIY